MNLLITGRGTSGSFAIRGHQLGKAIGATVEPRASKINADLVVIVKRAPPDLLSRIRQRGVPLVWDVVDSWSQPDGNRWGEAEAKAWLRNAFTAMRPIAIVAATEMMAKDCAEFGVPVLALPHHGRPGQMMNPIRKEVRKVGYEGSEQHLEWWAGFMQAESERRGWEWVVNPQHLADLDIVVAVRGSDGYAPRNWKSGVKLSNAQATGTPCIVSREAGYLETSSGGEFFADTQQEMTECLDRLALHDVRRASSALLKTRDTSIETVAETYKKWLARLRY